MQLQLEQHPVWDLNSVSVFVTAHDCDKNKAFAGRIAFKSEITESRVGKIYNFFVAKRYRGEGGAASVLMRHVEIELVRRGFRQAALTVSARNQHAQAFYERLGWQKMGPVASRGRLLRYEKSLTQKNDSYARN